jgi:hypothetical protein
MHREMTGDMLCAGIMTAIVGIDDDRSSIRMGGRGPRIAALIGNKTTYRAQMLAYASTRKRTNSKKFIG